MSHFQVYLSSDANAANFTVVASTDVTEVMLANLKLTVGKSYFTYVTAIGTNGLESAPSEMISFTY